MTDNATLPTPGTPPAPGLPPTAASGATGMNAASGATGTDAASGAGPRVRKPHPIEVESFQILRSRVDLSPMPPLWRAVTERVIHASADLDYAVDILTTEEHLAAGLEALRAGAPVVTDVEMVAAGITARDTVCQVADPATGRMARAAGITRSAAAVRLSYAEVGPGAVWVVGCAPTALFEIIERGVRPALVIGLPVGFVGATESKQALRDSGLPQVSNFSEKGGSAVAAAACNALLYHEGDSQ